MKRHPRKNKAQLVDRKLQENELALIRGGGINGGGVRPATDGIIHSYDNGVLLRPAQ